LVALQVFRDNRYICRDKFFGRGLSPDGFYSSLALFLNDGKSIRTEVIPRIVMLLDRLAAVVSGLDSYRLYGSSLVVVYEGDRSAAEAVGSIPHDGNKNLPENVGRYFKADNKNLSSVERYDMSSTFDRESEARTRHTAVEQTADGACPVSRHYHEVCGPLDVNDNVTPAHCRNNATAGSDQNKVFSSTNCHKSTQTESSSGSPRYGLSPTGGCLVDVRIVDFANCTCSKLAGERRVQHVGCDSGFMFGLKNLRDFFVRLQREADSMTLC